MKPKKRFRFNTSHFLFLIVEENPTAYYYFSVLSGPLLAIAIASVYSFIPFHNVLTEPCYWYEYQIVAILVYVPLLTWCSHPLYSVYYMNLYIKNKWFLYFFLNTIACGTWIAAIGIYFYLWKDFTHPMPMNFYVAASATYAILPFAILLG